jgi:hypothetical protein
MVGQILPSTTALQDVEDGVILLSPTIVSHSHS